jgi:hypothetical protein
MCLRLPSASERRDNESSTKNYSQMRPSKVLEFSSNMSLPIKITMRNPHRPYLRSCIILAPR